MGVTLFPVQLKWQLVLEWSQSCWDIDQSLSDIQVHRVSYRIGINVNIDWKSAPDNFRSGNLSFLFLILHDSVRILPKLLNSFSHHRMACQDDWHDCGQPMLSDGSKYCAGHHLRLTAFQGSILGRVKEWPLMGSCCGPEWECYPTTQVDSGFG